MENLEYLIELMKDKSNKFMYVNTSNGQLCNISSIFVDDIVTDFEKLKSNKTNPQEQYVFNFVDFATIETETTPIKKWFSDNEDFEYMQTYYRNVYDTFLKLHIFDKGIDNETLGGFDETYYSESFTIHVTLYVKEDPRKIYIKFTKEPDTDENC